MRRGAHRYVTTYAIPRGIRFGCWVLTGLLLLVVATQVLLLAGA